MGASHSSDRPPRLPEPLRAALAQLVPLLNATGAPWVMGGSCCLALQGVDVTPHDLDLCTDREGAYRIGEALRQVAVEQQPVRWGEGERIRSHRGLYQLGSVQVDIVGAAEYREGEGWTNAVPPAEWQTTLVSLPGTRWMIPVWTLEYELTAYRRLQREAKVKLIKDRLGAIPVNESFLTQGRRVTKTQGT